jgi:predicted component of type VI protein secretion system
MNVNLVVLTPGKSQGKLIPITLAQFLIGRDPQCQLRPASPVISKRHCALLVKGDKLFLHDFDSTNGTFLNDQPVKGEVEMKNGDQLKVGPLHFEVQIEATVPVNEPTPIPPTKAAALAKAPAAPPKTPPPPTKAPPAEVKTPAAKAPAAPPAKAPAAPAAKAPAGGSDDEDVAAMLLSLHDEGDNSASTASADEIPEGSTVMDLPSPFAQPPAPGEAKKEPEKKKPLANTSNAAKEILEKYMKRPRTTP